MERLLLKSQSWGSQTSQRFISEYISTSFVVMCLYSDLGNNLFSISLNLTCSVLAKW